MVQHALEKVSRSLFAVAIERLIESIEQIAGYRPETSKLWRTQIEQISFYVSLSVE